MLGLKLFLRGRLTLGKEHVKRRDQSGPSLNIKEEDSHHEISSVIPAVPCGVPDVHTKNRLSLFLKALEIQYEELKDWNCCGATSYVSIDEMDAFALAARNLALAELQSPEGTINLIAPCSACFLVLSKTERYLEDYPDVRRMLMRSSIRRASLQWTA